MIDMILKKTKNVYEVGHFIDNRHIENDRSMGGRYIYVTCAESVGY